MITFYRLYSSYNEWNMLDGEFVFASGLYYNASLFGAPNW
jgi:hypothetical protein